MGIPGLRARDGWALLLSALLIIGVPVVEAAGALQGLPNALETAVHFSPLIGLLCLAAVVLHVVRPTADTRVRIVQDELDQLVDRARELREPHTKAYLDRLIADIFGLLETHMTVEATKRRYYALNGIFQEPQTWVVVDSSRPYGPAFQVTVAWAANARREVVVDDMRHAHFTLRQRKPTRVPQYRFRPRQPIVRGVDDAYVRWEWVIMGPQGVHSGWRPFDIRTRQELRAKEEQLGHRLGHAARAVKPPWRLTRAFFDDEPGSPLAITEPLDGA